MSKVIRTSVAAIVIALVMSLGMPVAFAASGTMDCGSGGTPKTTGYGNGSPYTQYHWVQGTLGTYYTTSGNLTLYWSWRSGTRSWTVDAPNGGYGACII